MNASASFLRGRKTLWLEQFSAEMFPGAIFQYRRQVNENDCYARAFLISSISTGITSNRFPTTP